MEEREREEERPTAVVRATVAHTTADVDFILDENQKEAVIECIRRKGKLTLSMQDVGITSVSNLAGVMTIED